MLKYIYFLFHNTFNAIGYESKSGSSLKERERKRQGEKDISFHQDLLESILYESRNFVQFCSLIYHRLLEQGLEQYTVDIY